MKNFIFLIIAICLFHQSSLATPSLPLHETWTSVRALGMGNAYTAIVDDGDALFYNPAGLNRVSGIHWTILDPRIGIDDPNIVQTLNNFKTSTNIPSLVQSEYGKHHWLNAGAKSVIVVPHFGFGVFGNAEALTSVSNPPYPQLNLQYYADYGAVAGIGFDPIPEILKFGMDLKYISRTGTESTFTGSQLASANSTLISDALKNAGIGYGLDSGVLITIPGPIRPSLSFVWKNMGVTSFTQTAGTAPPPNIQDEMIVGGALEISAPLISITPAFDYKYANRTDIALGKKVSVGVELSLPILNFRGGLNQGYYTAGVGVNLGFISVDAATYGEELGEVPGQLEDRRYIVQATIEIGFDPFGIFGSGAGGSKSGSGSPNGGSYRKGLKQRR
jgi:hypothetical protein